MKKSKLAAVIAEAKLRGDVSAASCPSRIILDHVTSRWGLLVMVLLRDEEVLRFGELRRAIGGVSEKMLAQALALLEADGFVDRHAYAEVPPRVEYRLTPMGREIAEHLETLAAWIEDNTGRVLAARARRAHADGREAPRKKSA